MKGIRKLADGDVWASFSKNIDDENDKDRREDREVDISSTNIAFYIHPKATETVISYRQPLQCAAKSTSSTIGVPIGTMKSATVQTFGLGGVAGAL
jgi:hypothetical protein